MLSVVCISTPEVGGCGSHMTTTLMNSTMSWGIDDLFPRPSHHPVFNTQEHKTERFFNVLRLHLLRQTGEESGRILRPFLAVTIQVLKKCSFLFGTKNVCMKCVLWLSTNRGSEKVGSRWESNPCSQSSSVFVLWFVFSIIHRSGRGFFFFFFFFFCCFSTSILSPN